MPERQAMQNKYPRAYPSKALEMVSNISVSKSSQGSKLGTRSGEMVVGAVKCEADCRRFSFGFVDVEQVET
jgi:hypothetical protein